MTSDDLTSIPDEPTSQDAPATDPAGSPSWGTPPSTPPAGTGSEHHDDGSARGASGTGEGGRPGSFTTPPGSRFFDGIRRLGIVRPDEGRWGAGVAAGIAHRYGIDPVPVRIAFGVLTLLGGLGITLYGLAWLFLPQPDGRIHAQQVLVGTVTAGFVGALAVVLLSAHEALPLLVIALVVFLIVRHRRTSPHRTAA